jgi:hypothetical protein
VETSSQAVAPRQATGGRATVHCGTKGLPTAHAVVAAPRDQSASTDTRIQPEPAQTDLVPGPERPRLTAECRDTLSRRPDGGVGRNLVPPSSRSRHGNRTGPWLGGRSGWQCGLDDWVRAELLRCHQTRILVSAQVSSTGQSTESTPKPHRRTSRNLWVLDGRGVVVARPLHLLLPDRWPADDPDEPAAPRGGYRLAVRPTDSPQPGTRRASTQGNDQPVCAGVLLATWFGWSPKRTSDDVVRLWRVARRGWVGWHS